MYIKCEMNMMSKTLRMMNTKSLRQPIGIATAFRNVPIGFFHNFSSFIARLNTDMKKRWVMGSSCAGFGSLPRGAPKR
jgi:hypothetical protein